MTVSVRSLTEAESKEIERLARSRTESARMVERAKIIHMSIQGKSPPEIEKELKLNANRIRDWVKRFNQDGIVGLQDKPRSGAPRTYDEATVSLIVATALTEPQTLGLPFSTWTLDRLAAYLQEAKSVQMKRSRLSDVLVNEGLRWRKQEAWFGERVDPQFAEKGVITQLYTVPQSESVTVCIDEMGPESAKSFAGREVVRQGERATQEIDYGRRGKGYVFGAFQPSDGAAMTETYSGRTIANYIDFLEKIDIWIPSDIQRVNAIMDNLSTHRATDVLLFSLSHPRWEFVFQPKYAAYLNLIEPCWKVLRSLALKGRRFETWQEIERAIQAATAYWNQHRHPFVSAKQRKHRPIHRSDGIALCPMVA